MGPPTAAKKSRRKSNKERRESYIMALCKHMVRVPKRSEGHPEGTRSIGGLAERGHIMTLCRHMVREPK